MEELIDKIDAELAHVQLDTQTVDKNGLADSINTLIQTLDIDSEFLSQNPMCNLMKTIFTHEWESSRIADCAALMESVTKLVDHWFLLLADLLRSKEKLE